CWKSVSELEINAPAEKYHEVFNNETFHVPKIFSKIIQEVEVHGVFDGKDELFKERVEFDDKNLSVSLIGLGGDVFKHYKTFNAIHKVLPKSPRHSLVVLTLEYEKLDDGSPYPYQYLDLMNGIAKDIESHLK
ncbi:MLP-like protein 328, partial [Momordica charantia]|uniref:MLP-like protein 328 n=1 Tax=Momordica charantia TaxID=3673 RepID=A0A6J1D8T9_MOMCH